MWGEPALAPPTATRERLCHDQADRRPARRVPAAAPARAARAVRTSQAAGNDGRSPPALVADPVAAAVAGCPLAGAGASGSSTWTKVAPVPRPSPTTTTPTMPGWA